MRPILFISITTTVIMLACGMQASIAQNVSDGTEGAHEQVSISPTHQFDLDVHLGPIDTSPDGDTLYALATYQTVNVWEWLVTIWPRVILIPGLLLIILLLQQILKVRQHPQQLGEPHCRKCGYALTGSQSDQCPECGVSLKSKIPTKGRAPRQRLAFPLIALIVIAGALVCSNIFGPAMPESVKEMYFWPSRSLRSKLTSQSSNLLRSITPATFAELNTWYHEDVWAIRLVDGKNIQSSVSEEPVAHAELIVQSPSMDWYTYDLKVSVDERTVFLRRGASIAVVDITSATPIQTLLPIDGSSQGMIHDMESERVVLSADGSEIYSGNSFNEIHGWRTSDGTTISFPGVEVIRFASSPTNPDDPPFYHVWDIAPDRRRLFVFSGEPVSDHNAFVSKDGQRMYVLNHSKQRADIIDIDTRTVEHSLQAPAESSFSMDQLAITNEETLAAVGGSELGVPMIYLYDLKANQWLAKLKAPVATVYRVAFTKNSRRLIVHGLTAAGAANQSATLLVYEMNQVRAKAASTTTQP